MNNSKRSGMRAGKAQRGFLSSRQAIVVLGLLFIAPAFVAWVMHHSGNGGWRPQGTTNHGVLVNPARPLQVPDGLRAGDKPLGQYLQGLWTLVYVGDGDCNETCNRNLYNIRQVRMAQNEELRRVQTLYLLLGDNVPAAVQALVGKEYPDLTVVPVPAAQAQQLAAQFRVDDTGLNEAERVYFIDPLGNLMMYYAPDADPSGMLKDLQKLLKYSRIG